MSGLDHFRDKMECRWCKKKVNISTERAIVETDTEGYFWVYCRNCRNEVAEANDEDYLNNKFD